MAEKLVQDAHPEHEQINKKKEELNEAWLRLKQLALTRQEKLFGAHEIQRFNRDAEYTRGMDEIQWVEKLYEDCQKKGIQLIFSHVNEQPWRVMEKNGFIEKVGADNFCAHIDDALKRAEQL